MESSPHLYIPYGRQNVSECDIKAVENVLRSPFLTQGPVVPKFESTVAKKVSVGYAVAVNSATSALHLACLSLDLGPGDRVWTSPITFVASANCARYCGADVDFVDIDPNSGLMDVDSLKRKLKSADLAKTLPKIIIPVHLCGTSCDMALIARLADQYGVKVVEDASHAIGGNYKDQPVGNCKYSSITAFSFHPVKIITTGEGGIATTNDRILAQKMSSLRSHGIIKDERCFEFPSQGPWYYEQQELGFNYRLTDIQAALGLNQLQRLDEIIIERHRLLQLYSEKLKGLPLRFLSIPQDVRSSLHLAVIRLNNTDRTYHRRLFEGMRAAGIGVQLHYSPVHLQPYYRRLGYSEGDFPNAEQYAFNALSLPLFPGLTENDQDYVVRVLSNLLS